MFTGRFEVVGLMQGIPRPYGRSDERYLLQPQRRVRAVGSGRYRNTNTLLLSLSSEPDLPVLRLTPARGSDSTWWTPSPTGSLAAFIAEPILSAAGILEPPPGYFPLVKQMCEERGMLFILGRSADWHGTSGATFAFEQDGFVPDIWRCPRRLERDYPCLR